VLARRAARRSITNAPTTRRRPALRAVEGTTPSLSRRPPNAARRDAVHARVDADVENTSSRMVTAHFERETPKRLRSIVRRMRQARARVVK
jgi:hypothetical protein